MHATFRKNLVININKHKIIENFVRKAHMMSPGDIVSFPNVSHTFPTYNAVHSLEQTAIELEKDLFFFIEALQTKNLSNWYEKAFPGESKLKTAEIKEKFINEIIFLFARTTWLEAQLLKVLHHAPGTFIETKEKEINLLFLKLFSTHSIEIFQQPNWKRLLKNEFIDDHLFTVPEATPIHNFTFFKKRKLQNKKFIFLRIGSPETIEFSLYDLYYILNKFSTNSLIYEEMHRNLIRTLARWSVIISSLRINFLNAPIVLFEDKKVVCMPTFPFRIEP